MPKRLRDVRKEGDFPPLSFFILQISIHFESSVKKPSAETLKMIGGIPLSRALSIKLDKASFKTLRSILPYSFSLAPFSVKPLPLVPLIKKMEAS